MRGMLDLGDAVRHHPGLPGQRIARIRKRAVVMVDIGRAQHITQQLLEEIGFFIRCVRGTDAANCFGTARLDQLAQTRVDQIICLPPGGRLQRIPLANQRRAQALGTVHKLEAPATAIAQPAIVDLVVLTRTQAHNLVHAHIQARVAANATVCADTVYALELPGTSSEAIVRGGQRSHWTDFYGVARKDRVESMIGRRANLHAEAARDHHQAVVHRNLRTEARAALAKNAALTVQQHFVAHRNWFGIMALIEIKARAAGTVTQGEILQIALARLVADRTIQRVIDQQKLQRAAPGLENLLSPGVDHHALADRRSAGRLRRLGHLLDLDKTHAARAQRRHLGMIAINRYLDPRLLRSRPHQRSRRDRDRYVVDGQMYESVCFLFWQNFYHLYYYEVQPHEFLQSPASLMHARRNQVFRTAAQAHMFHKFVAEELDAADN